MRLSACFSFLSRSSWMAASCSRFSYLGRRLFIFLSALLNTASWFLLLLRCWFTRFWYLGSGRFVGFSKFLVEHRFHAFVSLLHNILKYWTDFLHLNFVHLFYLLDLDDSQWTSRYQA